MDITVFRVILVITAFQNKLNGRMFTANISVVVVVFVFSISHWYS